MPVSLGFRYQVSHVKELVAKSCPVKDGGKVIISLIHFDVNIFLVGIRMT